MICLAYNDDDKKSRKVTKKSSFLSFGLKNRLKSASTLSLPTSDQSGTLPWNKPCPSFPSTSAYNNDSGLYWTGCGLYSLQASCSMRIRPSMAFCTVLCCTCCDTVAVPFSVSTGILSSSLCSLYVTRANYISASYPGKWPCRILYIGAFAGTWEPS